ncbi:MAG: hypothetical protein IR153_06205 [Flavobacterium sp.]|nr:hypothetical protein [Flavobacterium sp.]
MTDRKLKIIFGLLSVGLLTTLLFKLTTVPGGMILSGLFLGGMCIVGIIIVCLILSGLLKLIFKKTSYLTLMFITTSISFLAFHYQLYSPTLTIIVPNDYKGEINLVLSNVDDNILTVDSNGIGYLNKWTFNKTYTKPNVVQVDGKNLEKNLVGFNPSTFFGRSVGGGMQILRFEIVPDDKIRQKQYYSKNLTNLVDKKLVLFLPPDEHTIIQTEATIIDTTENNSR